MYRDWAYFYSTGGKESSKEDRIVVKGCQIIVWVNIEEKKDNYHPEVDNEPLRWQGLLCRMAQASLCCLNSWVTKTAACLKSSYVLKGNLKYYLIKTIGQFLIGWKMICFFHVYLIKPAFFFSPYHPLNQQYYYWCFKTLVMKKPEIIRVKNTRTLKTRAQKCSLTLWQFMGKEIL